MDFPGKDILEYSEKHTSGGSALLDELERQTYLKVLMPNMLSGRVQGRILSMISSMIRPSFVLEIGTFTGYSAICLAEGLAENGKLITIDNNEELETIVREYLVRAGIGDKVEYLIGEAKSIIPELKHEFDLVFIDADKENYSLYFDLVVDKIRPGGFIIADNVLWSGKVMNSDNSKDKDTISLSKFNEKIALDKRVENVLMPVRDGLMLIKKLS